MRSTGTGKAAKKTLKGAEKAANKTVKEAKKTVQGARQTLQGGAKNARKTIRCTISPCNCFFGDAPPSEL